MFDASSDNAAQFIGTGPDRVLKLGCTIADLAGCTELKSVNLAETLQYHTKLMLG
jgi:predicted ATPase with chaperone activity